MSRAKFTYQNNDGRIVAITLHSEDRNLLVVETYWPAGGSPEALNKCRDMGLQITSLYAILQEPELRCFTLYS